MDEDTFSRSMKLIVPITMTVMLATILTFFLGEYRIYPSSNFSSIYISVVITLVVSFLGLISFRFFDRVRERDTETESLELEIEDMRDKINEEKKNSKIIQRKIEDLEGPNNAAYIEFFTTENNLRRFVESKMIKKWGKGNWIQKIPTGVLDQCKNYKKKCEGSAKLHSFDKKLSILAYSSLHELGEIIKYQANWDNIFKHYFPRQNISIIIGQIETLVPFRDNVAHMRPISSKDLVIIKNTCKLINDMIS